jgi:pimeloyl-ACP methyl ester carboxylesterase
MLRSTFSRVLPFGLTTILATLVGCAGIGQGGLPVTLGADPVKACAALTAPVSASAMGLPTRGASIDSAIWVESAPLKVAERAPTPAARVSPATPAHCRVLGRIASVNAKSPPILFQVNLPLQWNGRSVQYGGGGFNGTLTNALGLLPGQRLDTPTPLAQGFVTVGTDSGHQSGPQDIPQAFALDEEALVNFAHASYKKVRDVSMVLTERAFGRKPDKMYFMGSSEGGREGLVMAQRYPEAFDGIFSRVPVVSWTGLQHAGLRDGLALQSGGWLNAAQMQRVHDAVLQACDAADGVQDGLVANPVGCRQRFDVAALRCQATPNDSCLTDAQIKAVQTLHSPLRFDFDLAHQVREYPGRGPSGEALPSFGPTGGWKAWWLGSAPPSMPPSPANGIGWVFGAGAIQYFYVRDPKFDLTRYWPKDHAARIREVSELMDATQPDLSAFRARGGKLVMLEYMADYAQSPYAGIRYFESVQAKMGQDVTQAFARLYTAPGVDHVGSGAPAFVDMLPVLTAWVEQGKAPGPLQVVEQEVQAPFPVKRALPLCQWPQWPRYKTGEVSQAASFECVRD